MLDLVLHAYVHGTYTLHLRIVLHKAVALYNFPTGNTRETGPIKTHVIEDNLGDLSLPLFAQSFFHNAEVLLKKSQLLREKKDVGT